MSSESIAQSEGRGHGAPHNLQAANSAVMALLAGAAAERAFWPLCGLFATAVHEAAHCVAGYVTGAHATHVSIIAPDAKTAGYALGSGADSYKDAIRVPGRKHVTSDERCALVLFYMAAPTAGWRQYRAGMRAAALAASQFVQRHHWVIGQVAERLLKARELDGAAIRAAIETALADPRAALPVEHLPEVTKLERDVVVALAGAAAARRCCQGSAPGWKRPRTHDELNAHHEAAHAIMQLLHGQHIWELSILSDTSVRMQKSGFSGGRCIAGETPEPPGPLARPERAETDLRAGARISLFLALRDQRHGWRAALRIAHRLKERARVLVDENWPLIARLAAELVERRELDSAEIGKILKDRVER